MTRASLLAALLAVASIATPRLVSDEPNLKDVLRRMGAYVASYGEKAAIVVATERYTQEIGTSRKSPDNRRVTVGDFAIVKAEGLGGWVGFRDVIEVDGAPISDREDRLIQILTAASGRIDEAQRLSNESARFNIGPVRRNFNVPTAALFFFAPDNITRFKFSRKGAGREGTWEIAFSETARPTLVRTPEGASVPIEGSVWVEAATGTIVRTRVRMARFGPPTPDRKEGAGSAEIDVTYKLVDALGMWLPEKMTELYEGMPDPYVYRVTGDAMYTNYRQFQTAVRIK
jgi:hypothetical protein